MPIDRISPSPSLIETMRAIARDRTSGTRRGENASNPESSIDGSPTLAGTRQVGELRRRLHKLAKQVDVADPHSLADVRAPVLREILLWEFGSDFRSDSQFLPMVDAISAALDADPGFQQRLVELVTCLQKW